MAERKRLTLIYQHNDNWIGGTYYIINIIKVLKLLNDESKPSITIIYNDENSLQAIKNVAYNDIQYKFFNLQFNYFERLINKLCWSFWGTIVCKRKITDDVIETLYPAVLHIDPSNVKTFCYWIPDFQERYLPAYFSKKDISDRIKNQLYIKNSGKPVVFSSQNALADFNKFYPDNTNVKHVLNFVSMIDDNYNNIEIGDLKKKFNIDRPYLIAPNQFWVHKNQTVVVKAAKLLKQQNIDFQIVFTGKEFDHRNPDYVKNLKQYVVDNDLENSILFLGFIDRDEQLQLMKNSVAILQPSLFEGWSTVVEDAKALEHLVILSDIPLHKEQINKNCVFFDPNDEADLAVKIQNALNNRYVIEKTNYLDTRIKFAEKIISIL